MNNRFNKWNILKQELNNQEKDIKFRARDIYFMSVGQNIGKESYGKGEEFLRPVLVYKKLSKETFIGIPLTSKEKNGTYFFNFTSKGKKSTASLNQIKVFDIKRAKFFYSRMGEDIFRNLEDKLLQFVKITPAKQEDGPLGQKSTNIIQYKNDFVNKNNKNILVTGCAGFIGSNFVPYFLNKYENYNLINLDLLTYAGDLTNLKECEDNPRYKFIKGDICNRELVEFIFDEYNIDGVIHFAAESHVDNSIKNPGVFVETNVNGTFTLLDVAYKKWGRGSKNRFHHISTDEVYGTLNETDLFTENTPYAPNSPYSASKASSDMIVRSYSETFGVNTVITNCSNNYGPKQHDEKLIPTIIRKALSGESIPIYGDGKNIRDWLYVLDHCKGIDLVYHTGKSGEVYNIGGRNERTNLQIVNTICNILDELYPISKNSQFSILNSQLKSYKELITFVTDRPGHDRRYAIDASKIENELGWMAEENFESGIVKTVKWYLKKYM